MTWDFRNLIRRGGGKWPRDWRSDARPRIRPPDLDAKPAPPPAPEAVGEEHWLTPPWQPPEGSADAWRNAE